MLAAIGDNCIDRYVSPIDRVTVGGNALNVAVGLARRGHRTAYLGAVGDDQDGRMVVSAARAAGLDTSQLVIGPGATGVTLVELRPGGERVFLEERTGASGAYRPSPEALRFAAGCDWVHAAGLAAGEQLVPRIRGPRLSYDFSTHSLDLLEELAPHLEIAFLSADRLGREESVSLAQQAVEAGAAAAVVTRGRRGSLAWNGRLVERPADPVDVVDTLGAGDALISAVIAARINGAELGDALVEGGRAAAGVCRHYGAWEAK